MKTTEVDEWIGNVLTGPTGFEVWEDRECIYHGISREHSAVAFTLRALANPHCEGSDEILESIIEHRSKLL